MVEQKTNQLINYKSFNIPDTHGVYQYYDKQNTLIYVGKAKSLIKRISTYFTGEKDGKTEALVKNISDIKWIITNSEFESLQLENLLIKQHQPKYNILLKDDKTYPYIVIKNEPFPRVFVSRQKFDDSSEYYGPFPSSKYCDTLISIIEDLYPLRNCNLNLTKSNIDKKKFTSCLQKEIGKCDAPCIGLQDESTYIRNIKDIRNILLGDIDSLVKHIKKLILLYADQFQYEACHSLKQKIDTLVNYKSKFAVSKDIGNKEVYVIMQDEKNFFVNHTYINQGLIVRSLNQKIEKKLDESEEDVLHHFMFYIRDKFKVKSNNVITNLNSSDNVIMICQRDLKHFILLNKLKEPTTKDTILEGVQKDLRLTSLPLHIECFDNSNLVGTNPVSSVVVFKNGEPSKKDYRWYNIDVNGPDDYETMYLSVKKRYENNNDLPQLIVIDGGKGQLSSAVKALRELDIYGKVSIISIAKKLEEIYYPNDSVPMYINKRSYTLKLIQQLRDEAHRFGIEKHRNKRSKSMLESELDKIYGLGEKSKEKLLSKYKSVSEIKLASNDELITLLGKKIGGYLISYFISY